MTVLAAAISEAGEAVILADSRVFEDPSYIALKTLRVNDHCAIGCSGSQAWGSAVFAVLFNRPEWEFGGPEFDVFWSIEKADIERRDLTCEAAVETVTSILSKYAELAQRFGARMQVDFALVGEQEGVPWLALWRRTMAGWVRETSSGMATTAGTMRVFYPDGPAPEGIGRIMADTTKGFYARLYAYCTRLARAFPDKVDLNLWIRRSSSGFRRESLSQLVSRDVA